MVLEHGLAYFLNHGRSINASSVPFDLLDDDKLFFIIHVDRKRRPTTVAQSGVAFFYRQFDVLWIIVAAANNYQIFDYNGLKGRLFSTSCIPLEGHPTFNDMIIDLKKLYEKHQQNGLIKFEYKTEVIYGQLV